MKTLRLHIIVIKPEPE